VEVDYAGKNPVKNVVDASILFLPNKGPLSMVPISSRMFVETTNNLVFKDGVLTSREFIRGSTIFEDARLPLRIIDAVFASVARIVPFATQQTTDQTALINAQIALANALQSQKVLEAELTAAGTADIE
jgi:hypothetical protein